MGFTANLKQKKDFGNPELLQRVIEVFGIDEHASNYPPAIFDPHSYEPEDYIDQVRARQRQLEMEAITGPSSSQQQQQQQVGGWVGGWEKMISGRVVSVCLSVGRSSQQPVGSGRCRCNRETHPVSFHSYPCLSPPPHTPPSPPQARLPMTAAGAAAGLGLPPPLHVSSSAAAGGGPPPLPTGAATALVSSVTS